MVIREDDGKAYHADAPNNLYTDVPWLSGRHMTALIDCEGECSAKDKRNKAPQSAGKTVRLGRSERFRKLQIWKVGSDRVEQLT